MAWVASFSPDYDDGAAIALPLVFVGGVIIEGLVGEGETMEIVFDLEELDDMLDADVSPEALVGFKADWHGEIVPIVPFRGGMALKVVLHCSRKGCRHQMTVRAISGCHNGAYCYVYDKHGHFADLRNQEFVCTQHSKRNQGRAS